MTTFASQAQTTRFAEPRIEGNCGLYRPYIKASTVLQGWSSTTRGDADALLQTWDGYSWVNKAYQFTEKLGASGTAASDAGVQNVYGWFRGDSIHHHSSWISNGKTLTVSQFYCPP